LLPPFDRAHPRPYTLLFAVDRDAGRAFWVSSEGYPDGGTPAHAVPLPFPIAEGGALLVRDAAPITVKGPEIVWAGDPEPDGRRRVRVVPPPDATCLAVHLDAGAGSVRVQGRSVQPAAGGVSIRFHAPPASGVEIEFRAAAPVTVHALSRTV